VASRRSVAPSKYQQRHGGGTDGGRESYGIENGSRYGNKGISGGTVKCIVIARRQVRGRLSLR